MTDVVNIRLRKFMRNSLLSRRQCVVDVIHPNRANVSKADCAAQIAKLLKVQDPTCIFLFGFRTAFGGGKSTGFGLIYDSIDEAQKFEPRHRLVRVSIKHPSWCCGEKSRRRRVLCGVGRRCARGTSTVRILSLARAHVWWVGMSLSAAGGCTTGSNDGWQRRWGRTGTSATTV